MSRVIQSFARNSKMLYNQNKVNNFRYFASARKLRSLNIFDQENSFTLYQIIYYALSR